MKRYFLLDQSVERRGPVGPVMPVRLAVAAAAAVAALTIPHPAVAAHRHAVRAVEEPAKRPAGPPIMAIVSLKSQKVRIYDAEGLILQAPVSSGQKGRETPSGVFSVIQKDKDHHSNLYDDASMPNMERITWSGIALHGGPLPGYAASHGCVRMPYGFAENLFARTSLGMRVVIAPYDVAPVDIVSPALFQPKPDAGAHAADLAKAADEAGKQADEARMAAVAAAQDAARAGVPVRALENLKARAQAQVAAAEAALARAGSDDAKARAQDAKTKADAKLADLTAQLTAAQAALQPKQDAVVAARAAAATAAGAHADALKAAREAKAALAPVSVFISRKTQKLYVRRGFEPVLEVPVTIRDPEQPIGTYIFTAIARTDAGLRWNVVALNPAAGAANALERITIPQEVLDRIAPTASPRSSIIVSDEPLSRETGSGTEFVVVMSNEPQGGLAMRHKTTPQVRYAREREQPQTYYTYPQSYSYSYSAQRYPGQYSGF